MPSSNDANLDHQLQRNETGPGSSRRGVAWYRQWADCICPVTSSGSSRLENEERSGEESERSSISQSSEQGLLSGAGLQGSLAEVITQSFYNFLYSCRGARKTSRNDAATVDTSNDGGGNLSQGGATQPDVTSSGVSPELGTIQPISIGAVPSQVDTSSRKGEDPKRNKPSERDTDPVDADISSPPGADSIWGGKARVPTAEIATLEEGPSEAVAEGKQSLHDRLDQNTRERLDRLKEEHLKLLLSLKVKTIYQGIKRLRSEDSEIVSRMNQVENDSEIQSLQKGQNNIIEVITSKTHELRETMQNHFNDEMFIIGCSSRKPEREDRLDGVWLKFGDRDKDAFFRQAIGDWIACKQDDWKDRHGEALRECLEIRYTSKKDNIYDRVQECINWHLALTTHLASRKSTKYRGSIDEQSITEEYAVIDDERDSNIVEESSNIIEEDSNIIWDALERNAENLGNALQKWSNRTKAKQSNT